jgi:flavodoxin
MAEAIEERLGDEVVRVDRKVGAKFQDPGIETECGRAIFVGQMSKNGKNAQ